VRDGALAVEVRHLRGGIALAGAAPFGTARSMTARSSTLGATRPVPGASTS
jgi:hypothetical protein